MADRIDYGYETWSEKFKRKFNENPWVPLGKFQFIPFHKPFFVILVYPNNIPPPLFLPEYEIHNSRFD